jgi:hypothetical protein
MLPCSSLFIRSTAWLYLGSNNLTGTIATEIALMTNLSESSIACCNDCCHVFFVACCFKLLLCFFLLSSHACITFFQSTDDLYLYNNSLTGTIPSQIELLTSLSKCRPSVVCICVVFDHGSSHSNS